MVVQKSLVGYINKYHNTGTGPDRGNLLKRSEGNLYVAVIISGLKGS